MKEKGVFISLFVLMLIASNLSFAKTSFIFPVEIDYTNPETYLSPGTQSEINPKYIETIEREIGPVPHTLNGIAKILQWLGKGFKHYNGGGRKVGKSTINKLLETRLLSGCHDNGLVFSCALRHFGFPSVMVDTAGIEWALVYNRNNPYSGHVFIEVCVQGKWILLDSNSGEYIEDYDPYNPVIPITKRIESKGYYVLYKGIDPAGYGVTDIKILNAKMDQFAQVVGKLNLEYPPYTISRFKRPNNNRP